LRDGDPDSYIGKINLETGRLACRKWAARGADNGGSNAAWDRMCKPYLEDIGQYPGEPTFGPAVTGVQCPTIYTVTCDGDQVFPDGDVDKMSFLPRTKDILGPIGGIVRRPNQSQPRATDMFVQAADGLEFYSVVSRNAVSNDFRIVSIVRKDGQPDNCGDPSPTVNPPSGRGLPGPTTITINPEFEIEVDVDFDPSGDVTIIFDPDGDPVEVPISPTRETEGPDDIGDPAQEEDTGTGGEAEGEADEGEVLTGVSVEVVDVPVFANVNFDGGGALYRGAYYVYLGADSNLDLQPEGAISRVKQFYYAPEPSTEWRVVAGKGYNVRVTPYYRPSIE